MDVFEGDTGRIPVRDKQFTRHDFRCRSDGRSTCSYSFFLGFGTKINGITRLV